MVQVLKDSNWGNNIIKQISIIENYPRGRSLSEPILGESGAHPSHSQANPVGICQAEHSFWF